MIWKTRRYKINFRDQENANGLLMGILNTTPDSFSDGGQNCGVSEAVHTALKMVAAGAKIIDIGGESTRPGAAKVSAEEEIQRTAPVVRALREKSDVLISIDTSKAVVAAAALEEGADIVNDVTGLTGDPAMTSVCAGAQCGVVIMHMQGNPRTMQVDPHYEHGVVQELHTFFAERLETLAQSGIDPECIILDPGIGFGKTVQQNIALMQHLADFQGQQGRPVLLGVSRKSIIAALTGVESVQDRDAATAVVTAVSAQQGVLLHRVHHVAINAQALLLAKAICS